MFDRSRSPPITGEVYDVAEEGIARVMRGRGNLTEKEYETEMAVIIAKLKIAIERQWHGMTEEERVAFMDAAEKAT